MREGGLDAELTDAAVVTQLTGEQLDVSMSDPDSSVGVTMDERLVGQLRDRLSARPRS